MSGELDLIRAFHAEDAVVDASSQNEARAALLEHIDGSTNSTPGKRSGWLRRPSRPVAVLVVALVIAGSAAAAVSRSARHSRSWGGCRERSPLSQWRATTTRSQ